MLAERSDEAIRIGGEALTMAEELGLDELRAHALNNIGVSKANMGDLSGLDDLRKSIDIGTELNSPEVRRALNNLGTMTLYLGDLPEAERLHAEALAVAERFGIAPDIYWCRSEVASDAFQAGRWDEAAPVVDRLIEESAEGIRHYMETNCRYVRGQIRLARGDPAGAVYDARANLELSAGIKDAQTLYPARAGAARVFLFAGRQADAAAQVDALLADVAMEGVEQPAAFWALDLAVVMDALGRGSEFLERAPTLGASTPWLDAGKLWAAGEFSRAADVLGAMGARPDEALARLRAAEQLAAEGRWSEVDQQLGPALAFFRSVGATRYIGEGESLLEAAS